MILQDRIVLYVGFILGATFTSFCRLNYYENIRHKAVVESIRQDGLLFKTESDRVSKAIDRLQLLYEFIEKGRKKDYD